MEYWVNLYFENGDLKVSPHYTSHDSAIYHRSIISRQFYGEPLHVILPKSSSPEQVVKPTPIGATGTTTQSRIGGARSDQKTESY